MYDNTHRLHTVITERGVEKVYNADVDTPSGVAKVPAPWDRAENYNPDAPLLEIVIPMSPGAAPNSLVGSFSPRAVPQAVAARQAYSVPENDPPTTAPSSGGCRLAALDGATTPSCTTERGALGPVEAGSRAGPPG